MTSRYIKVSMFVALLVGLSGCDNGSENMKCDSGFVSVCSEDGSSVLSCVDGEVQKKPCNTLTHEVCNPATVACAVPCTDQSNCLNTEICDKGYCAPIPPECTKNEDCGEDKICTSGKCEPAQTEPECTKDEDCGEDKVCTSGKCEPAQTEPECASNADCESWEKCNTDGQCELIKALNCGADKTFINGVCVHNGMLAAKPGDTCAPEWRNDSYCDENNRSVYCWRDGANYTLVADECTKCHYIKNGMNFTPTCDNAYTEQCNEAGDKFLYCDDRMEYGKVSSQYVCTETMNGTLVAFDQFELGNAEICVKNKCNADNTACDGVEVCDPATFTDRCTEQGDYQYCKDGEVVTMFCSQNDAECHLVKGLHTEGVVSGGCFIEDQMCEKAGVETPACKVEEDSVGMGHDVCTPTEDGAFVKIYSGHKELCEDGNGECNDDFTACKDVIPCTYGVDSDSCENGILKYCSEEGKYESTDCGAFKQQCLTFSDITNHTIGSCMDPVTCKNEGKLEDNCNSHRTYSTYCAKAQDGNLYRIELLTEVCSNGYGPCNKEGTACETVESCDPNTYDDTCSPEGTLLTCNKDGGFIEKISCAALGKQCLIINDYYASLEEGMPSLDLGGCYAEFDLCDSAGDVESSCFAHDTFQGVAGTKECYETTTANVNVALIEGTTQACKYGQAPCNDDFTACSTQEAASCKADDYVPSCINDKVLLTCSPANKVVKTNCAATDESCHVIENFNGTDKATAQCFSERAKCTKANETKVECYENVKQGTITSKFVCTETQDGSLYWVETVLEACSGGKGQCAEDGQSCVPAECDPATHVNSCDGENLVSCKNYKLSKSSCEDYGALCGTIDGVGQCLEACTSADTKRSVCGTVGTHFETQSFECKDVDGRNLWVKTETKRCKDNGCNSTSTACISNIQILHNPIKDCAK